MDSRVNGDYLAVNREKQGQQDHEASVHRKGRTNACHLSGTSDVLLWGLPFSRQLSVFAPSYLLRCEKYRMLYAWMLFLFVPPKPHSRQPSLSDALLGVAIGEVSQAEESTRKLSGRYSLRCLLANPLPCHSLRLVPRV